MTKSKTEAPTGEYSVKGVKKFMGSDCPGYNATLMWGKTKVAFVIEAGDGGPLDIQWLDSMAPRVTRTVHYDDGRAEFTCHMTPEAAALRDYLDDMEERDPPKDDSIEERYKYDMECFISGLVAAKNEDARRKRFVKTETRRCEHMTVFRLASDVGTEVNYRSLKNDYRPFIRENLIAKYGDDLIEIVNETTKDGTYIPIVYAGDKGTPARKYN